MCSSDVTTSVATMKKTWAWAVRSFHTDRPANIWLTAGLQWCELGPAAEERWCVCVCVCISAAHLKPLKCHMVFWAERSQPVKELHVHLSALHHQRWTHGGIIHDHCIAHLCILYTCHCWPCESVLLHNMLICSVRSICSAAKIKDHLLTNAINGLIHWEALIICYKPITLKDSLQTVMCLMWPPSKQLNYWINFPHGEGLKYLSIIDLFISLLVSG